MRLEQAICCSVVPRPSHHPVFNCFQYIKTGSDQKWMVGRPGNEVLPQCPLGFFLLMLDSTLTFTV